MNGDHGLQFAVSAGQLIASDLAGLGVAGSPAPASPAGAAEAEDRPSPADVLLAKPAWPPTFEAIGLAGAAGALNPPWPLTFVEPLALTEDSLAAGRFAGTQAEGVPVERAGAGEIADGQPDSSQASARID